MKQADGLTRFRIETSDVRPFKAIAVRASQCEIAFDSLAPLLFGNDVIYLKWQGERKLWDQAVLPLRPCPDKFSIHCLMLS